MSWHPVVFEAPASGRGVVLSGFVFVVGDCVVGGTGGIEESPYGVAWGHVSVCRSVGGWGSLPSDACGFLCSGAHRKFGPGIF